MIRSPEHAVAMRAGKEAAAHARRLEREKIDTDGREEYTERHDRAYVDLLRLRVANHPEWYK